jgi:hypothetical protein
MSKDKLLLACPVQALQNAQASCLSYSTPHPLPQGLTTPLEMRRGTIRARITLDDQGGGQPTWLQEIRPFSERVSGALLAEAPANAGRQTHA